MADTIKIVCGAFMVLALFQFLLREFLNGRPQRANAEEPTPKLTPGALSRLINSGALISLLVLLLPIEQLWIA